MTASEDCGTWQAKTPGKIYNESVQTVSKGSQIYQIVPYQPSSDPPTIHEADNINSKTSHASLSQTPSQFIMIKNDSRPVDVSFINTSGTHNLSQEQKTLEYRHSQILMTEDSQLDIESPQKHKKMNDIAREFPIEMRKQNMIFSKEMSASPKPSNIEISPNQQS